MSDTKRIYLDYAASTPVDPRVLESMQRYWSVVFGNAGGLHKEGVIAKQAVEEARATCAGCLHAHKDEIIFTSGGSESNNLAIFGVAEKLVLEGKQLSDFHFLTSVVEHSSVLDCFKVLEKKGAQVTYVSVEENGIVNPKTVQEALRENTVLVSIMYVNSEIGTIMPVAQIAKVLREHRKSTGQELHFHTDATQAPAYVTCYVEQLGVDMLTIGAQKMYGPKGVGLLYKKRGVDIAPIMRGGNQEHNMRPGTPNVPLISGLTEAFQIAEAQREVDVQRIRELRDFFIEEVEANIPQAKLNGDREQRSPNNANFSFLGSDGEFLVLQLDAQGIAASTRSACLFEDKAGSFVVAALGKGTEYATSAIRFTLGRTTTKEDIDRTVEVLKSILAI